MAVAWEPYQEIFLGVITCIHSDFRLGGLDARSPSLETVFLAIADGRDGTPAPTTDQPAHQSTDQTPEVVR